MPTPLPDTMYDSTHTWQNMNDRVAYDRSFSGGSYQERTIAQAMIVANPVTSNAEIEEKMTAMPGSQRTGIISEQMGIREVLDVSMEDLHLNDMHTTDFSGRVSGYEGTSIPTLPMW